MGFSIHFISLTFVVLELKRTQSFLDYSVWFLFQTEATFHPLLWWKGEPPERPLMLWTWACRTRWWALLPGMPKGKSNPLICLPSQRTRCQPLEVQQGLTFLATFYVHIEQGRDNSWIWQRKWQNLDATRQVSCFHSIANSVLVGTLIFVDIIYLFIYYELIFSLLFHMNNVIIYITKWYNRFPTTWFLSRIIDILDLTNTKQTIKIVDRVANHFVTSLNEISHCF